MLSSSSLFRQTPLTPLTNKCVVLDLDQTLVATQDSMRSLEKLGIMADSQHIDLRCRSYYFTLEDFDKKGVNELHSMWGITRPHIQEFLAFCFSYFRIVAVWSAGSKKYVEAIVEKIFRDLHPPHLVFTAEDTIFKDDNSIEKPLSKMMKIPSLQKLMLPSNTFVIDDNDNTIVHNPDNGILIPPFDPQLTLESMKKADPTLLSIREWLLTPEVMSSPDVLLLDKKKLHSKLRKQ